VQAENMPAEDLALNSSAPPGKSLQYAKPELERRFLLAVLPAGRSEKVAKITDRYFLGTRLRLRSMQETIGNAARTYYKLTQKIPAANGGPGLVCTTYLNRPEFDLLSTLPGATLRKTRHSIPPFGVDVFEAPLAGLILAECEFEDRNAMQAFVPSIETLAEVTHNAGFNGGHLVTLGPADLAELLLPFRRLP
jgi:CYTH domain-containing protein